MRSKSLFPLLAIFVFLACSCLQAAPNPQVTKLLKSARKYADKGKNQDAINSYWKVLELDATASYAYLELGEIYKKLKIYDRAIEVFSTGVKIAEKELDKDSLCEYYCVLTELYHITDQQGLANKALIKAAGIAPKNPLPRKVLGDIYQKNKRYANAAKAYRTALELDPNYTPALDALSKMKMEGLLKIEPKKDKLEVVKPKTQLAKGDLKNPLVPSKEQPKESIVNQKLAKEIEAPKPIESPNVVVFNSNFTLEKAIEVYLAGNTEEKEQALAYLISQGANGLKSVEELLYDSDPNVRILGVRALPLFYRYKKDIKEILLDAEEDTDPDVAEEVRLAIEAVGTY